MNQHQTKKQDSSCISCGALTIPQRDGECSEFRYDNNHLKNIQIKIIARSNMNIDGIKKRIFILQSTLPNLLLNAKISYAFGENRPYVGDDSDENWRGCLGGNDIGGNSGIYIFSNDQGDILYIGKATKNNLHNRVWNHLGAPKRLDSGWMTFPNTNFISNEFPEYSQTVVEGKSRLHVFTVSDPDIVSMIEVYLQVAHIKSTGRLPIFNKQIG